MRDLVVIYSGVKVVITGADGLCFENAQASFLKELAIEPQTLCFCCGHLESHPVLGFRT
ncbi:Hypothetical protein (plasmid) [Pseudomonas putida]|nr:Hypothetical protein [Pseudomonas putida]